MTKSLNTQTDIEVEISNDHTTITHPLFGDEPVVYSTRDVIRRFYGSTDKDSGLFPPVVRYFSADLSSFIVERTPCIAKINFNDVCPPDGCISYDDDEEECSLHTDQHYTFEIPVPWTIYVLNFHKEGDILTSPDMWMFFRNRQVFTTEDILCVPPLPNVYTESGNTCLGNLEFKFDMNKQTIEQAINSMINNFWASEFNNELYIEDFPAVYTGDRTPLAYLQWLSTKTIDEVIEFEFNSIPNYGWIADMYGDYKEASKEQNNTTTIGDVIGWLDRHKKTLNEKIINAETNPLLKIMKILTHGLKAIDLKKQEKKKSTSKKKTSTTANEIVYTTPVNWTITHANTNTF